MSESTSSVPQEHNASVAGQRVRFLDRDPVPPSLRGKEALLERAAYRTAVVRVAGARRYVPKEWLVAAQGSTASAAATSTIDRGSATPDQPTSSAGGDDDPITEQAWYGLLEACLELNLNPEEARQVISEAAGVPLDELDPSRLTWRQYLQVIERLEQLEAPL